MDTPHIDTPESLEVAESVSVTPTPAGQVDKTEPVVLSIEKHDGTEASLAQSTKPAADSTDVGDDTDEPMFVEEAPKPNAKRSREEMSRKLPIVTLERQRLALAEGESLGEFRKSEKAHMTYYRRVKKGVAFAEKDLCVACGDRRSTLHKVNAKRHIETHTKKAGFAVDEVEPHTPSCADVFTAGPLQRAFARGVQVKSSTAAEAPRSQQALARDLKTMSRETQATMRRPTVQAGTKYLLPYSWVEWDEMRELQQMLLAAEPSQLRTFSRHTYCRDLNDALVVVQRDIVESMARAVLQHGEGALSLQLDGVATRRGELVPLLVSFVNPTTSPPTRAIVVLDAVRTADKSARACADEFISTLKRLEFVETLKKLATDASTPPFPAATHCLCALAGNPLQADEDVDGRSDNDDDDNDDDDDDINNNSSADDDDDDGGGGGVLSGRLRTPRTPQSAPGRSRPKGLDNQPARARSANGRVVHRPLGRARRSGAGDDDDTATAVRARQLVGLGEDQDDNEPHTDLDKYQASTCNGDAASTELQRAVSYSFGAATTDGALVNLLPCVVDSLGACTVHCFCHRCSLGARLAFCTKEHQSIFRPSQRSRNAVARLNELLDDLVTLYASETNFAKLDSLATALKQPAPLHMHSICDTRFLSHVQLIEAVTRNINLFLVISIKCKSEAPPEVQ